MLVAVLCSRRWPLVPLSRWTAAFDRRGVAGNADRAMVLGALVGVLWIASDRDRPPRAGRSAFELGDLNGIDVRRAS